MGVEMNVCPNCNWGRLEKLEGKLRCPACGAEFNDETSEIITHLNEEQLEKMRKYRVLLDRTLREENISLDKVRGYCDNILKENPDDLIANFYNDLCDSNRNTAIQAIENITERIDDLTEGTVDLISDVLIKSLKKEYINYVNTFIQKAYFGKNNQKCAEYMRNYEAEAQKIDEGIFVPSIPRDVFILYSSKDANIARELVEYLEVDNKLRCFWSQRNLQHGIGSPENYEAYLKEAIRNCKCFVYVSTPNSRSIDCDAFKKEKGWIEADRYARDRARIEYRPLPKDTINKENNFDRALREFFRYERCYVTKDDVVQRVLKHITAAEPEVESESKIKVIVDSPEDTENDNSYDASLFQIEKGKLRGVISYQLGQHVVIPKEVKYIAPGVFANTPIESVELPENLESIGESAFADCRQLKTLTFAPSCKLNRIEEKAFLNCPLLDNVELPEKVKFIGAAAFKDCKALSSFRCSDKLSSIGDSAFEGDTALAKITLPDSVNNIGKLAFSSTGLCYISLPKSLKEVSEQAFADCYSLQQVALSSGITAIKEQAFANCSSLNRISNLTNLHIESQAFANCEELSLKIPKKAKNIDERAFEGCPDVIFERASKGSALVLTLVGTVLLLTGLAVVLAGIDIRYSDGVIAALSALAGVVYAVCLVDSIIDRDWIRTAASTVLLIIAALEIFWGGWLENLYVLALALFETTIAVIVVHSYSAGRRPVKGLSLAYKLLFVVVSLVAVYACFCIFAQAFAKLVGVALLLMAVIVVFRLSASLSSSRPRR